MSASDDSMRLTHSCTLDLAVVSWRCSSARNDDVMRE